MISMVGADEAPTPEVSFIIPLHRDGPTFRRCLDAYFHLEGTDPFEVIVVADQPVSELPGQVVRVVTGSSVDTSPATKRDAGGAVARGSILAYIDDDAYPAPDWMERASEALREADVSGIGGPGLTPPESTWRERLGGSVYESPLGSGPLRHRFLPVGDPRDSDDLPAFNFAVRRSAMEAVGGWASTFYGGEDTKVCLELVRAGFRLRYVPDLVVYHHRRAVLLPHLRQVANVGRHRGFFVRRYPETSRRLIYFLPGLAVAASVPSGAAVVSGFARRPRQTATVVATTWAMLAASASPRAGAAPAVAFPPVLALHHLVYGINFLRGALGRGELTT